MIQRAGSVAGRQPAFEGGSRIAARRRSDPQVLHGATSADVQLSQLMTGSLLFELGNSWDTSIADKWKLTCSNSNWSALRHSIKLNLYSRTGVIMWPSDIFRTVARSPWQTPPQQILSALCSFWATASSSPVAATAAFMWPTSARPALLRFHLHQLRLRILPSGGRRPQQVQPPAGSWESPHLVGRSFPTWGNWEKLWVQLSWTLDQWGAAWVMSECRGHQRSTAGSPYQVSLQL